MLRPSWQLSAAAAAGLLLLAVLARRRPPVRAFATEFTAVMCLLGLWQFIGRFVRNRESGAIERGEAIARWQRAAHLPAELTVQRLVLPHAGLVRALDVYYAFAHLNGMAIFLLWMWWRHRSQYRTARTTIVVTTLACLLIQTVPVAPPRLLPGLGFVDTAMRYGQSVYGGYADGLANQLSAMPSVHVGWAVVIAWYAARSGGSRWRWLGALHAVLTIFVVVATANHWWLDGLVAAGIAVLAGAGQVAVKAAVSRRPVTAREAGADPSGLPVRTGMMGDAL